MATSFYLMQSYSKCIEKATESLEHEKSIKGYYRRGKAHEMRKDFEGAMKDFEAAIKMDTSDPNDIGQELL